MIRTLFSLLLFIIFFLAGMIFGMGREQQWFDSIEDVPFEEPSQEMIYHENEDYEILEENQPELSSRVHVTQTVATILENSVKTMYELIVKFLYRIASLFFDSD